MVWITDMVPSMVMMINEFSSENKRSVTIYRDRYRKRACGERERERKRHDMFLPNTRRVDYRGDGDHSFYSMDELQ